MSSEKEEENGGTTTHGKPNAYWAKVREEQIEEESGDTYSGAFRGVKPPPHGGAASVRPANTLGADELCWCGQPLGHDWPGKRTGARHPKTNGDTMPSTTGLERRDLRAYDKVLQDFILHCVGPQNLRYRLAKNSVILYPPDGTAPVSVYARNSDRQVRQLERWFNEHVVDVTVDTSVKIIKEADVTTEVEVTPEQLAALAAAKNGPEHKPTPPKQVPRSEQPIRDIEDVALPEPVHQVVETAPEPVSANAEWTAYVRRDDGPSPNIETDGHDHYRCKACMEAGRDQEVWQLDGIRSIGGHNRMWHTDISNMHDKEARARAVETRRRNITITKQLSQAIDILIEASGYVPTAQEELIEDLQAKLAAASKPNDQIAKLEEALAVATKRADEAEAKLALIREATGL